MGPIKVHVELEMDSETEFIGTAKLMGLTIPYKNGKINGDNYQFAITVKLPFGELPVEVDANLAADGTITGFAHAPNHKPMEIEGVQVQ
uniref:hypothetical protein n=1 Tax=Clostridium sp. NkU-1 TaxID=1095009 RepID=UPI0006D27AC7